MSITVLSETNVKFAMKTYNCDACEAILYGGSVRQFVQEVKPTFSEIRALAEAKSNNFKIMKGESYIKQANVQDGDFYVFRSLPKIHAICLKYDIYQEP